MPSVLVTGAARGIGRSITEHLASAGWDVVAGVRSERDAEAITALDPVRISAMLLDVTDTAHLDRLDAALPSRLDAVVNNAGIVVSGALETVSSDDWRKQLDINVVGQLAVTRAVLPRLRESRGRVLFISSINGQLSTPMVGAYAASKFALEAAAMALRMELRPWGISVIVVEPAQTDTDMWRTADAVAVEAEQALTPEHRALYARHIAGFKKSIPLSQRIAVAPQQVATTVERALTARRPRARYVVGWGPRLQVALLTNMPSAGREWVLRKFTRQP